MAQQFHVQYIDDIDGTELGSEAETIAFSFEGKEYTIDLGEANAAAFREAMEPYIQAAHRVTGARKKAAKSAPPKAGGVDTKAIREWARENGWDVSDRGRIPADVMAAYADAN